MTAKGVNPDGLMTGTDSLAPLIERAQRLDPTAFEELVDLYSSRLFGFVFRLIGHRQDADDLVQEVFLRVVQRIGDYVHDGKFEAWLFRIAMNLVRDRVRKARRTPLQVSGDAGGDESPGGLWEQIADGASQSPRDPLELADDLDRLQRAVARLPQAEREVVMLRHYSELTFVEIAEIMGTPLGTALARSHRALTKLRQYMEESS